MRMLVLPVLASLLAAAAVLRPASEDGDAVAAGARHSEAVGSVYRPCLYGCGPRRMRAPPKVDRGRERASPPGENIAADPVELLASLPDETTCTRTYDLPRVEDSWGWRVALRSLPADIPRDLLELQDALVSPGGLVELIRAKLASGAGAAGLRVSTLDLEDRARLRVRAPLPLQTEIEEFIQARTWTPAWLGEDPAVEELAAMLRTGTPLERDWADSALSRGTPELRDDVDVALRRPLASRALPGPSADAARRHQSVQVQLRLLETDRNMLRDIGVDVRSLGISNRGPGAWSSSHVRSQRQFLDDTQVEVIFRAVERRERMRSIEDRSVEFECGASQVLGLGSAGVVMLHAAISANQKHVTLRIGLRLWVDGTVVFAPDSLTTMPNHGVLLLAPQDTLLPTDAPARGHLLLLHAEFEPEPDGRDVPQAPNPP